MENKKIVKGIVIVGVIIGTIIAVNELRKVKNNVLPIWDWSL